MCGGRPRHLALPVPRTPCRKGEADRREDSEGENLGFPLREKSGAWLSLVEHLNGVQGVASSNLAAPIIFPWFAERFELKRESEGETVPLRGEEFFGGREHRRP